MFCVKTNARFMIVISREQESNGDNQPVIKVVARHPITSDAAAVSDRAVGLEEAREVARTLVQKLHRIQRNIVELKHVSVNDVLAFLYSNMYRSNRFPLTYPIHFVALKVAQSIMQAFIYDGSEYQLNLPGTVRSRTEEKFKDWLASLFASVTRDAQG